MLSPAHSTEFRMVLDCLQKTPAQLDTRASMCRLAYGAWSTRLGVYRGLVKSGVTAYQLIKQWSTSYLPELQATLR